MKYINTRNKNEVVNDKTAIINGLAKEGGLYVPEKIEKIKDIYKLKDLSYKELAYNIISIFFKDLDLKNSIDKAYNNFETNEVTPLKKINNDYFLELYHGPTCAFKDVALGLLPYILTKANNDNKPIFILSATSGDTGKAALEAFKDIDNTKICVLYPYKMVSITQERQMSTTLGKNVDVIAVKGNFDDCQKL